MVELVFNDVLLVLSIFEELISKCFENISDKDVI